jgi:hypothetical protein
MKTKESYGDPSRIYHPWPDVVMYGYYSSHSGDRDWKEHGSSPTSTKSK